MDAIELRTSPQVDLVAEAPFFFLNRSARMKRAEDLIVALLLLVLTFPVMLLSALAIKLDSKGPILLSQSRRGQNQEIIRIWRFRSMYFEASDQSGRRQSTFDDPRITYVGAFLRRHGLDELPQLFNVICGDMSIVGPRPQALDASVDGDLVEVRGVSERTRCSVKPGITGWAQTNGYWGKPDTMENLAKRAEHDLYYIRNWSVWLDMKILIRTASCVLRDDVAH
jgi:polysaccharide biosynthesis protein PslA